jgi:hypothetical protein
MSHETHAHHEHDAKPVVQFNAGIYFVLILAGLFLASIAFVKSMSHSEGGHGAHETEATHEGHEGGAATHEATEGHEGHAAGTEAQGHEEHAAPAAPEAHHEEAAHH